MILSVNRIGFYALLLLIVSGFTLIGGRFFSNLWLFDLFNHFLPIQIYAILIATSILIFLKRKGLGFLFLIGAGLILMASEIKQRLNKDPYALASHISGFSRKNPNIQVIAFNVYTGNQNKIGVLNWILSNLDPKRKNIIFLMEVNDAWIQAINEKLEEKLPFALKVPREDNFGAALYTDIPFRGEIVTFDETIEVPAISAEFKLEADLFHFYGVHPVPPISKEYFDSRNVYFGNLRKLLKKDTSPIICAGDFNSSPWSPHFTLDSSKVGPDLGSDHKPVIVAF